MKLNGYQIVSESISLNHYGKKTIDFCTKLCIKEHDLFKSEIEKNKNVTGREIGIFKNLSTKVLTEFIDKQTMPVLYSKAAKTLSDPKIIGLISHYNLLDTEKYIITSCILKRDSNSTWSVITCITYPGRETSIDNKPRIEWT